MINSRLQLKQEAESLHIRLRAPEGEAASFRVEGVSGRQMVEQHLKGMERC